MPTSQAPQDKKPKLTPKQRIIVKKKVEGQLAGKSQNQIAREVYPNQKPNSAAVTLCQELKKPNVQEAVEAALAKAGITVEAAVAPIADGLRASKAVMIGSGEDAILETIPDHSIRLKASGMALALLGANKGEGTTIVFNFGNHVDQRKYVSHD